MISEEKKVIDRYRNNLTIRIAVLDQQQTLLNTNRNIYNEKQIHDMEEYIKDKQDSIKESQINLAKYQAQYNNLIN